MTGLMLTDLCASMRWACCLGPSLQGLPAKISPAWVIWDLKGRRSSQLCFFGLDLLAGC